MTAQLSYNQQRHLLLQAISQDVGSLTSAWVQDVYDDHMIYSASPSGKMDVGPGQLYSRDYTITAQGKVTLGTAVKVAQTTNYVASEAEQRLAAALGVSRLYERGDLTTPAGDGLRALKESWSTGGAAAPRARSRTELLEAKRRLLAEPDAHTRAQRGPRSRRQSPPCRRSWTPAATVTARAQRAPRHPCRRPSPVGRSLVRVSPF